jgi:hypothetical protein
MLTGAVWFPARGLAYAVLPLLHAELTCGSAMRAPCLQADAHFENQQVCLPASWLACWCQWLYALQMLASSAGSL